MNRNPSLYSLLACLLEVLFFLPLHAQTWEKTAFTADSLASRGNLAQAIPLFVAALEQADKTPDKNYPEYFAMRNKIGKILAIINNPATFDFLNETDSFFTLHGNKNSQEYALLKRNWGIFYSRTQNDSLAESNFLQCLDLCKQFFGDKSLEYSTSLSDLGIFYDHHLQPRKAEHFYSASLVLRDSILGKEHPEVASTIYGLSVACLKQAKFAPALAYATRCADIRKKVWGEKNDQYASALNLMAIVYSNYGEKEQAEIYYLKASDILKNILGENNAPYANSLNNLASVYADKGEYANAEILYRKAADIRKAIIGEESSDYAASLNNLAALYAKMGLHENSISLYERALRINQKVLGEKHPETAVVMLNLAGEYSQYNDIARAEKLMQQAAEIQLAVSGDKHDEYAASLCNLATLQTTRGHYKAAEQLFLKAADIHREILSEKHPAAAENLQKLALLYAQTNRYEKAEELQLKATAVIWEVLGEEHLDFLYNLNNLAQLKYIYGKYEEAFETVNQARQIAVKKAHEIFLILTEEQKELFFTNKILPQLQFFDALAFAKGNEMTGEIYDTKLATKAILLQASQKIKNRILNSKDSFLIAQYRQLTDLKQNIHKAEAMTFLQRKELNIPLDSLRNEAEILEKKLSKQSNDFAKLYDNEVVTWKNIQEKLKENEAAIEIVRYQTWGVKAVLRDSSDAPNFPEYPQFGLKNEVQYAALIIKKKSKLPELVPIPEGDKMEKNYSVYHKNMIFFKRNDSISYQKFWKPIAQALKGIKKVFLSPDGVYNQIALEALFNQESGKFVFEEIDLQLLTNTKDMLSFGKKEKQTQDAVLMGYPIYDSEKKENDTTTQKKADKERAFTFLDKVSLLPGTLQEVKNVQSHLQKSQYQTQVFLAENATEENLKQVHSPKILHISTHGFFIDKKSDNSHISPMLRSGLLLAGVSNRSRTYTDGQEDGVLTAQEAANLDLDETDLVVLSACETGLGDVKSGEGVYGLQRAFRVAGAKTLIMSHWKVDDAVTQELMSVFYERYAAHHECRRAFREAREWVKNKHPEPYFWAAFEMFGE